jgi:hypothetical protein
MAVLGVVFIAPTPPLATFANPKMQTRTLISSPFARYGNFDFGVDKFDFAIAAWILRISK